MPVDALLERREEWVVAVGRSGEDLVQERRRQFVPVGRLAGCPVGSLGERFVEQPVQALMARLHAEVDTERLEPTDRQHIAVGQPHVIFGQSVRDPGDVRDVLRIAPVERLVLRLHPWVRTPVHLGGRRFESGQAARDVAGAEPLGRLRQIRYGQEPAVRLPERGPAPPAEDGPPQVLVVRYDRVGAEAGQEVRALLRGRESAHPPKVVRPR